MTSTPALPESPPQPSRAQAGLQRRLDFDLSRGAESLLTFAPFATCVATGFGGAALNAYLEHRADQLAFVQGYWLVFHDADSIAFGTLGLAVLMLVAVGLVTVRISFGGTLAQFGWSACISLGLIAGGLFFFGPWVASYTEIGPAGISTDSLLGTGRSHYDWHELRNLARSCKTNKHHRVFPKYQLEFARDHGDDGAQFELAAALQSHLDRHGTYESVELVHAQVLSELGNQAHADIKETCRCRARIRSLGLRDDYSLGLIEALFAVPKRVPQHPPVPPDRHGFDDLPVVERAVLARLCR